ncbi:MAG TPA: hypothetical protein VLG44_06175 [Chlamydiales bacterium]|nr:hypothetical protein [Chlamydiales bacterium]
MTPASSLSIYSPTVPIRLDHFGKRFENKRVMVRHLLPFLDIKSLSCFLHALNSGLGKEDRLIRLMAQAVSSRVLFLDELLEYFWYTGKTLDDLVKDQFSFTRKIRHLSLCSSEYNKDVIMHPLIRAQLKSLPDEWDAEFLGKILSCFPLLRSVDLSGRKLEAGALARIPAHCPHLVRLVLQGMDLQDDDLLPIEKCDRLEQLDLQDNPIEGDCLRRIVKPRIFSLSLSYTHVDNSILLQLKLPFLRRLELRGTELQDSGLRAIADGCLYLTYLDIQDTGLKEGRITNYGILYVAKRCQNLKTYLFAECSALTDKLLGQVLPHCSSLTECNMTCATQVTDKGLQCALVSCPKLESIHFSRTSVGDTGFELFKEFATRKPKLLGSPPSIDVYGTKVTVKSLKDVPARFPCLQNFSFDEFLLNDELAMEWLKIRFRIFPAYSLISDEGLDAILKVAIDGPQHYQTLDLRRSKISSLGLMQVPSSLPQLEHLFFDPALLTDEVMAQIVGNCTALQGLNLVGSILTDKGVQIFIQYAHKFPGVLGSTLSLDLTGLPVTKETILLAARLLPLRKLAFNHDLITDELVVEMTRLCPTLRSCTTNFERMTEVGFKAFASLPSFTPL